MLPTAVVVLVFVYNCDCAAISDIGNDLDLDNDNEDISWNGALRETIYDGALSVATHNPYTTRKSSVIPTDHPLDDLLQLQYDPLEMEPSLKEKRCKSDGYIYDLVGSSRDPLPTLQLARRDLQADLVKKRCETCKEGVRCKKLGKCDFCKKPCETYETTLKPIILELEERNADPNELQDQDATVGISSRFGDIPNSSETGLSEREDRYYTVGSFGPGPIQSLLTRLLRIPNLDSIERLVVLAKAKTAGISAKPPHPVVIDTAHVFTLNEGRPKELDVEVHKVENEDVKDINAFTSKLNSELDRALSAKKKVNGDSHLTAEEIDKIIEEAVLQDNYVSLVKIPSKAAEVIAKILPIERQNSAEDEIPEMSPKSFLNDSKDLHSEKKNLSEGEAPVIMPPTSVDEIVENLVSEELVGATTRNLSLQMGKQTGGEVATNLIQPESVGLRNLPQQSDRVPSEIIGTTSTHSPLEKEKQQGAPINRISLEKLGLRNSLEQQEKVSTELIGAPPKNLPLEMKKQSDTPTNSISPEALRLSNLSQQPKDNASPIKIPSESVGLTKLPSGEEDDASPIELSPEIVGEILGNMPLQKAHLTAEKEREDGKADGAFPKTENDETVACSKEDKYKEEYVPFYPANTYRAAEEISAKTVESGKIVDPKNVPNNGENTENEDIKDLKDKSADKSTQETTTANATYQTATQPIRELSPSANNIGESAESSEEQEKTKKEDTDEKQGLSSDDGELGSNQQPMIGSRLHDLEKAQPTGQNAVRYEAQGNEPLQPWLNDGQNNKPQPTFSKPVTPFSPQKALDEDGVNFINMPVRQGSAPPSGNQFRGPEAAFGPNTPHLKESSYEDYDRHDDIPDYDNALEKLSDEHLFEFEDRSSAKIWNPSGKEHDHNFDQVVGESKPTSKHTSEEMAEANENAEKIVKNVGSMQPNAIENVEAAEQPNEVDNVGSVLRTAEKSQDDIDPAVRESFYEKQYKDLHDWVRTNVGMPPPNINRKQNIASDLAHQVNGIIDDATASAKSLNQKITNLVKNNAGDGKNQELLRLAEENAENLKNLDEDEHIVKLENIKEFSTRFSPEEQKIIMEKIPHNAEEKLGAQAKGKNLYDTHPRLQSHYENGEFVSKKLSPKEPPYPTKHLTQNNYPESEFVGESMQIVNAPDLESKAIETESNRRPFIDPKLLDMKSIVQDLRRVPSYVFQRVNEVADMIRPQKEDGKFLPTGRKSAEPPMPEGEQNERNVSKDNNGPPVTQLLSRFEVSSAPSRNDTMQSPEKLTDESSDSNQTPNEIVACSSEEYYRESEKEVKSKKLSPSSDITEEWEARAVSKEEVPTKMKHILGNYGLVQDKLKENNMATKTSEEISSTSSDYDEDSVLRSKLGQSDLRNDKAAGEENNKSDTEQRETGLVEEVLKENDMAAKIMEQKSLIAEDSALKSRPSQQDSQKGEDGGKVSGESEVVGCSEEKDKDGYEILHVHPLEDYDGYRSSVKNQLSKISEILHPGAKSATKSEDKMSLPQLPSLADLISPKRSKTEENGAGKTIEDGIKATSELIKDLNQMHHHGHEPKNTDHMKQNTPKPELKTQGTSDPESKDHHFDVQQDQNISTKEMEDFKTDRHFDVPQDQNSSPEDMEDFSSKEMEQNHRNKMQKMSNYPPSGQSFGFKQPNAISNTQNSLPNSKFPSSNFNRFIGPGSEIRNSNMDGFMNPESFPNEMPMRPPINRVNFPLDRREGMDDMSPKNFANWPDNQMYMNEEITGSRMEPIRHSKPVNQDNLPTDQQERMADMSAQNFEDWPTNQMDTNDEVIGSKLNSIVENKLENNLVKPENSRDFPNEQQERMAPEGHRTWGIGQINTIEEIAGLKLDAMTENKLENNKFRPEEKEDFQQEQQERMTSEDGGNWGIDRTNTNEGIADSEWDPIMESKLGKEDIPMKQQVRTQSEQNWSPSPTNSNQEIIGSSMDPMVISGPGRGQINSFDKESFPMDHQARMPAQSNSNWGFARSNTNEGQTGSNSMKDRLGDDIIPPLVDQMPRVSDMLPDHVESAPMNMKDKIIDSQLFRTMESGTDQRPKMSDMSSQNIEIAPTNTKDEMIGSELHNLMDYRPEMSDVSPQGSDMNEGIDSKMTPIMESRLGSVHEAENYANLGRLVPSHQHTLSMHSRDVSDQMKHRNMYFLGDGIKLPLNMKQHDDGSLHLSVDVKKLCKCKHCNGKQSHNATLIGQEGKSTAKRPETEAGELSFHHKEDVSANKEESGQILKEILAVPKDDQGSAVDEDFDGVPLMMPTPPELTSSENEDNLLAHPNMPKVKLHFASDDEETEELFKRSTRTKNSLDTNNLDDPHSSGETFPIFNKLLKGYPRSDETYDDVTPIRRYSAHKFDDKLRAADERRFLESEEKTNDIDGSRVDYVKRKVGLVTNVLDWMKKIALDEAKIHNQLNNLE